MPTPDDYADFAEFEIILLKGAITTTSLALCCLMSQFATNDAFAGRYKIYEGTPLEQLKGLTDDGFTTTSKPYKMVAAFQNQVEPIKYTMVGRLDAGDVDVVSGVKAVIASKPDFFGMCVDTRAPGDQLELAILSEQRKDKFYITVTKDPLALVEDAGSIALQLEALQLRQCAIIWYDAATATRYGPAVVKSKAGPFRIPNGRTIGIRVNGGAKETVTFPSAPAVLTAAGANSDAPYELADGDDLQLKLNGGPTLVLEFVDNAQDFPDGIDATSTAQLGDYARKFISGLITGAAALKAQWTTTKAGSGASIEIVGGSAAAKIGFPVGTVSGTGFAADASVATSTEVKTRVNLLPVTGATAATEGKRWTLTSTDSGEEVSIEIVDGTALDEFGIAAGKYKGVGTLENYLDCQILGRGAGFNLDVPGGSVGWDNQTVPQTPGNVLPVGHRKVLQKHRCNTYEAVTNDRPGELHKGVTPSGYDIDAIWAVYWARLRGAERVKAFQNRKADLKQRIPYTFDGIAMYDQIYRGLLQDMATNGMIIGPELRPKDPTGVRTLYFKTPTIKEQLAEDKLEGIFRGWESFQQFTGSGKSAKFKLIVQTPE